MSIHVSTANLITLSRVPLLWAVAGLLYLPGPWPALFALGLLPVLFLMDWFDGYWARTKNQVTDLGSVLDIAIDRVVENVLWIVFAHQHRVPVWIPVLFITRSFVVDGLRGYALAKGYSAFGMMSSTLGRFLVAGRLMRGLYGLAKGLAFGGVVLEAVLVGLVPSPPILGLVSPLTDFLVYLAAGLCVIRGLPVLWDIRGLLARGDARP